MLGQWITHWMRRPKVMAQPLKVIQHQSYIPAFTVSDFLKILFLKKSVTSMQPWSHVNCFIHSLKTGMSEVGRNSILHKLIGMSFGASISVLSEKVV